MRSPREGVTVAGVCGGSGGAIGAGFGFGGVATDSGLLCGVAGGSGADLGGVAAGSGGDGSIDRGFATGVATGLGSRGDGDGDTGDATVGLVGGDGVGLFGPPAAALTVRRSRAQATVAHKASSASAATP